jgi:hypothetical protein
MDNLGLEIKPDGERAFAITRKANVVARIVRSKRDRYVWIATLAGGITHKSPSVSDLLDWIADKLPR